MPDTSRNFTEVSSEEIWKELERREELWQRFKGLKFQLKLYSYCPGVLLWTKDRRELRGKEAIEYLKKKLVALTKELRG